MSSAISLSSKYLVSQLSQLDKSCPTLGAAFAARALQLARNPGGEAAFEILAKCRKEEEDFLFWEDESGVKSTSVRATSLALLMYSDRGEMMTDKIVRWLNENRLDPDLDLPSYSMALESVIAWEEKFPAASAMASFGLNYGARARSVVIGDLNTVQKIDLGGGPYFSHVRIEGKGRGRALAVLTTKYFDSSSRVAISNKKRPLKLEAAMTEHSSGNRVVIRACQR